MSSKSLLIIFTCLFTIKLVSYTLKLIFQKQQVEIDKFEFSEWHRLWDERLMAYAGIGEVVRNKLISPSILPRQESEVYNFSTSSLHKYLVYLMEHIKEPIFDTIADVNLFPDSLRYVIKEQNSINRLVNYFTSNRLYSVYISHDKLIPIIYSIKETDSKLEIKMKPFDYPEFGSKEYDIRIEVNSGKKVFYTNPFPYTGDITKVKAKARNPVSNEIQIITFN